MLPLRFPKVWFGVGWAMLSAVIIGSLLPGGAVTVSLNDKAIHFSAYFLLMVWFAGLYERQRHYLAIATVLVALGICLDLLQGGITSREFDVLDITANTLGVACGLVAAFLAIGGWCLRLERWIVE